MFRIDDVTAANALPTPGAAGTPGYFTEGNPGLGVPATKVTGDWLNMIQEEIANVVTGAGGALSKSTFNQLFTAIQTLIGSAVPTGNVAHHFGSTAPSGWIIRDGKTIGSASSSATGRANADTLALYTLIWNNTDNTMDSGAFHIQDSSGAPTSRGASAAADFAANKRLPLPDDRGRFDRGLNTAGTGIDPSRTLGASQADAFKDHTHTRLASGHAEQLLDATAGGSYGTAAGGSSADTTASATGGAASGSGTETRPANRAYLPIIKL